MASATTQLKLNILSNFQEQMEAMISTEGLALGLRALGGVMGLVGSHGGSGIIEEAGGRNELLQGNKYP